MTNQKTILLVDDEPDILEFLSYNFRKKEFKVVTAKNGLEAIKKVEYVTPHVIVSDLLMPEMNGEEMCQEIRKISIFNNIPFIFLSAVHNDYKIINAMLSGGDEFIAKPIRFENLFAIVNRVMADKRC